MGGLIAAAAAPVVAPQPVLAAGWVGLWLLVTAAEQVAARKRGYVAADRAGLLVTCSLSLLCAAAALVLIEFGEGGARFFAVVLMAFSCVNIVLRFYASPRMLLAAIAPHAAVLGLVAYDLSRGYWTAGERLRLLTPAAALAMFILLLWPARRKLVDAWSDLMVARDLAERRRVQAEQASRAKTAFLATISHEIRTPLNGILGMVQSLYADCRLEQREPLRVIRRSGETLLAILDDVLDASRLETGQLRLEAAEFDMEHVTRGAAATFAASAARKGLAFGFLIEESAKGAYLGDALRIRQILHNLISNAIKFTEDGEVAVVVSYRAGVLRMEVADSGCGIAPDARERIFEPFVQADASATRAVGGAGLGLSICRDIAGLMGGSISVSSEPGMGSVFAASLPLPRVGAPRRAAPPPVAAQPPADPADERPIRVLAAEDNAVNRLVLKALLSQSNVELELVEDGAQAVAAWRRDAWDVVLMDIQMPVKDGVAATREIRAFETAEGRARTPVIAVTANVLPAQRAAYRDAGMDLVIDKPIEADKLFAAIGRALETAAARS